MRIAGDIGGTKTVLALFSEELGPHNPLHEMKFKSIEYHSLAAIVEEFRNRTECLPSTATFGVAGPVHNNRVQVTNLPWVVDARILSRAMDDVPIYLINDLEAIAYSVPTLDDRDLVSIKTGDRDPTGAIAVIAPGTGLGEAYLFWDGRRYRPIPSEGGHTDFAPATPLELELLDYLQPRLGHVSYERVCSGLGIPNLYAFLRDTGKFPEPDWLNAKLEEAPDATPVIVKTALEESAEICVATLDLFVSILGSEAGNLALQVVATGGVYLGGGIPPRILPQLKGKSFFQAFTRKGRFSEMLMKVPVQVIKNPKAALYGAANHSLTVAKDQNDPVNAIK